jgi:protein-tyrosine phosphatase
MTDPDRNLRTIPEDADERGVVPMAAAVRIGERDLWVGNEGAADPTNLDELGIDVAHVVTVNKQATAATTDFHPLSDARVNDQSEFDAAVAATRRRHRQDGSLLVHCAAGISRSVTVAATSLAAEEDSPFDAALDTVTTYREAGRPHPKLEINAYRYLAAECQRDVSEQLEELISQVNTTRTDDIDTTNWE